MRWQVLMVERFWLWRVESRWAQVGAFSRQPWWHFWVGRAGGSHPHRWRGIERAGCHGLRGYWRLAVRFEGLLPDGAVT